MEHKDSVTYDIVFDAATTMFRAGKETGQAFTMDIARLMYAVINDWEKNPRETNLAVIAGVLDLAVAWNKVVNGEVSERAQEVPGDPVPPSTI